LRTLQCACDAVGPKTLLGDGNVLRGEPFDPAARAMPCSSDDQCGTGVCRDTARCTTAFYVSGADCPRCDSDPSLHRSDPRLKDTDGDRVTDADEVFGYRTGAGIVSAPTAGSSMPSSAANNTFYVTLIAGADGVADSVACADNYCVEDSTRTCSGGA